MTNPIAPIFKSIYLWSVIWLGSIAFYGISIKYGFHLKEWQQVIYITQMVADSCIGFFSFLAFKNARNQTERKFYLLIFLSLIPGLFTNEVYNLLINLVGVKDITIYVSKFWAISYMLFLSMQIVSWLYLLVRNKSAEKKKSIIKLLYMQPVVIILLSLTSVALFGNEVFHKIGGYGAINSILEAALFILISACLARTKNNSLALLETGFLLLIAFNLLHRFSYITGHYTKLFDVAWMISLIFIIVGLMKIWMHKNEKIEFFSSRSIYVITNAIFVSLATLLLVVFILVDFAMSSLEVNGVGATNILPQNIPTILIFSYLLTLLISRKIASHIASPLELLSKKIHVAYEEKPLTDDSFDKITHIDELDKLSKFILDIIYQLQAANRVKSDFLMNMSHDFRTPASGIYQMASLLHKKMTDATLSNHARLVVDSSEQLIRLLDDVLDYSQLEGDRHLMNIERFDVESLVNEIILFLSAKVQEKSLKIRFECLQKQHCYSGDRLAIHRVLLNLVSNAIKFTHQGLVVISVTAEKNANNSWLIIRIQDTGIGIDPLYHQSIFEPFYRITSADNAKYSGIGLGLSNANLMIKKMGGTISLKSQLGVGSVFSVHLPVNDENQP